MPPGSGRVTSVITSPAASAGGTPAASGSGWNSAIGTLRVPVGPAISTNASKAASATHRSDGCVAMQASDQPRTAWLRVTPPIAEQPDPATRRLQSDNGSWK